MPSSPPLDRVLEVARACVARAGEVALRHHGRLREVETKGDGSPVTIADREAEAAIRATIHATFPEHGILGEEGGASGGGVWRWIVDPIDGTRGFARGGAHWGPLVAAEHEGEIVAAAMSLPVLGRTWWASRGGGTFRDGVRCRVGGAPTWAEATVSLGEFVRRTRRRGAAAIASLAATASSVRSYGDLAGCAMLLDGVADAWIEGGVSIWDLAAPMLLVEEAGGVFTDFDGRRTPATGDALAASPALHAHALTALVAPTGP